eukprot:SAG22_NODE_1547_length_4151_cov_3.067868_3_plen_60_part_00
MLYAYGTWHRAKQLRGPAPSLFGSGAGGAAGPSESEGLLAASKAAEALAGAAAAEAAGQ